MDVFTGLSTQRFVWDSAKAASNWEKHSISFEQAREAFLDPLAIFEDATATDEVRESCLGETFRGALLFVVHVERENYVVRILSARLATNDERYRYEHE